ncbi:MAG: DUF2283 domain-containing protein [Candidatus Omnitrophota bacterium]|nr:DUF2283 domain-containing protein [Candidatus Omnitrophota bacterium]
MKISYDEVADALYIQFQPEAKIKETVKIREGILCDIDKSGRIFGIEVLDVSKRLPIEELGKLDINLPVHAA